MILLSFYSIECCSQERDVSEFAKDVYGMPVFTSHDTTSKDYLTLDGKRILASLGVEYIGGRDSLNRYCKKMYYKLVNPTYNELNQRVFITLLFDKDLNIKEIRLLPPVFLYRRDYYEKLFTIIAKSTQGQWKKKSHNKDWYVYSIINHFF